MRESRRPQPPVRTGIAVVDACEPLDSFDFSGAERWELLILESGVPWARLDFPSPGAVDSAELASVLIHPRAQGAARGRELSERLLERLGAPRAEPGAPPACSVVLCTHGRPRQLETALDGLAALDPPPREVIVVDNDPGELDCAAAVASRGFTYLREDRRGLDNARNAGARAARGEVIAFTDDDCVHPPGWLARLVRGFDDPTVAAVTGPAFPHRLDTPAQVRMERQASLTRGLRPRLVDWTLTSALKAGAAGVGANMAVRGDLVRQVHEPFPPELDAGTETMSGGDTYLFARLLAAGHRIAYEPGAYVFHQHREDWAAVEHAVRGYGTGVSAALTKLLVEDGELEAPRAALWLVSQYLRTQARRASGRADSVETRIAWTYLRGAFDGPGAWLGSRARQRAIDPGLRPAPAFAAPTASPARTRRRAPSAHVPASVLHRGAGGAPAVSVIIPTLGRGCGLTRCLAALERQTLPPSAFEVVLVDDSPGGRAAWSGAGATLALRVHRTGGRGAAVARNQAAELARSALLVFLDDDLVAEPDLLERHLARHATGGPGATGGLAVIGYSAPAPRRPGLAALGAALWWEDHFRAMERAPALTFTHALSGNVSISRAAFLDGLRFDDGFALLRREDWEWGFRLLSQGTFVYEPAAVAAHEYELSAGQRIRACRLEGSGDARLVERHPAAAPFLPLAQQRPGRAPRRAARALVGSPRAEPGLVALLTLLERARLRGLWSAIYRSAQRAAYAQGLRGGGWRRPHGLPEPPLAEIELTSEEPWPTPGPVASRLRVRDGGELVAELAPGKAWEARTPELLASLLAAGRGGNGHRCNAAANGKGRTSPSLLVLVGPGRRPGDQSDLQALRALGARVELCEGDPARHWQILLERARRSQCDQVAIPLPGRRPAPGFVEETASAFLAPRLGLLVGAAVPPREPAQPLTLHDGRGGRVPYAPLGGPADYLVLRRTSLVALERAVSRAAVHGPMAVAFACVEEALGSGVLVGHRDVHGLDPSDGAWPSRAAREGQKLEAWGALLADEALERPRLQGLPWLAGLTVGGLALGALRRRRGRASAVSTMDTGRALVRGYAAAVSRRQRP